MDEKVLSEFCELRFILKNQALKSPYKNIKFELTNEL